MLQVVPEALAQFPNIDYPARKAYHAMVWNVDRAFGRIVAALKAANMFNNALIVMSSDNGGPIYMQGRGGGNNFPLKGTT